MRKLVELLAEDGVPMAVASGSSREAILAGTGLDAYLRTVVSAEAEAGPRPHRRVTPPRLPASNP